MLWLMLPFAMLKEFIRIVVCLSVERNALTLPRHLKLTGEKHGFISDDWDVTEIKAASKKCGASFNDFMMAMISVALYRFFEQHGKKENRIRISIPVSFRKNAKSAEALDLMNDIAPLFIDLNLNPNFEVALAQVRANTMSIRR
jgi:NRPS condensation-like uncharacterized protein